MEMAKLDIAVTDYLASKISLILQTGTFGAFELRTVTTKEQPASIAIADVNGDRGNDLVVSGLVATPITVMLNGVARP